MKKMIRKLYIRFFIWIGYEIGLWRNVIISKRSLSSKDLMSEFLYLTEACYYTNLDRDYLKVSVRNRAIASILLMIEKHGNKSRLLARKPEELKELIEKEMNIGIEQTELGYKLKGEQSTSFWLWDCPKEYKRLMELFSICLKVSEESSKLNQGS